jgi:hypothetical protein
MAGKARFLDLHSDVTLSRRFTLVCHDKTEERRKKRHQSRLFFGYFLLAAQKKLSRIRVRKPDT